MSVNVYRKSKDKLMIILKPRFSRSVECLGLVYCFIIGIFWCFQLSKEILNYLSSTKNDKTTASDLKNNISIHVFLIISNSAWDMKYKLDQCLKFLIDIYPEPNRSLSFPFHRFTFVFLNGMTVYFWDTHFCIPAYNLYTVFPLQYRFCQN